MLRVPGALDPLLGRPISVFESNAETGETTFCISRSGAEQRSLPRCCRAGDRSAGAVRQRLSAEPGPAVVIGGGIGTARCISCEGAARDRPARRIDVFLGFREEAYCVSEFERYATSVSVNVRGIVTNDVDFTLGATYYACGPAPMLRAAAQSGSRERAALRVARKAHGLRRGACLGCTCQTAGGGKRVCKDGPCFDYREVQHAL
jgi:dihydroorotate dehydrogenase electron transfer subunit